MLAVGTVEVIYPLNTHGEGYSSPQGILGIQYSPVCLAIKRKFALCRNTERCGRGRNFFTMRLAEGDEQRHYMQAVAYFSGRLDFPRTKRFAQSFRNLCGHPLGIDNGVP